MAHPSAPAAACYEIESAWGEDIDTAATYRVALRDAVDVSGLLHESEASGRVEQYRTGGSPHVKMTMGGTFKVKVDWRGHGTTMVGSPSLDALETLDGIVLGTSALSLAASQTLTGGTAAAPTTSGATGLSAGSLCRVGALGDGDGDGQMYAVGTQAGSTLTLLGDLNGAPVNGAVLYPVAMTYPSVTTSTVQSTRWLLQSLGEQYVCHGCFPMSRTVTGLNPGERATIEYTFGVSWWELSTATFPSATASDSYNPAPIAAGSLNIQVVGTTTRNVRTTARSLTVEHTINVMPLMGYGGVNQYQKIVGAVRGDDTITITFVEDADATTLTPVVPVYWDSTGSYHLEWTGSSVDGKAIGFKCPKVCPSGNKPVMFSDGGVNRFKLQLSAYTGGTTTNALTLAPIVYGWA